MAVDMFLKIDGIEGESKDQKHKGEIELVSFSWDITNSARSGGGAGKATVQDFSIVKLMDSASPALFEACCTGEHISNVSMVAARKAGGSYLEYLKIKFTDILVSSVRPSGGRTDVREQVSFSFTNVDIAVSDGSGRWSEASYRGKGTELAAENHH